VKIVRVYRGVVFDRHRRIGGGRILLYPVGGGKPLAVPFEDYRQHVRRLDPARPG
jgi:hypothetical protein